MPKRLPYDGTGHVDIWAKFMSNDEILIAQLDTWRGGDTRFEEIADYLDEQAQYFQREGLRVIRLPIPEPVESPALGGLAIRTYINSLQVNNKVMIPTYYNEDDLNAGAADIYRQFKFEGRSLDVVNIPSDQIILQGGSVHCATMQIPRPLSSNGDGGTTPTQPVEPDNTEVDTSIDGDGTFVRGCYDINQREVDRGRRLSEYSRMCIFPSSDESKYRISIHQSSGRNALQILGCRRQFVSGFSGERIDYICGNDGVNAIVYGSGRFVWIDDESRVEFDYEFTN